MFYYGELQSGLCHPNIVKIYDFFETKRFIQAIILICYLITLINTLKYRFYCIVLELLNNGELFHFINERGPLSEKEARFVIKEIANGLKYLHDKHIVLENQT